jgi:CRP-like cAMP-binding protein
MLTMTLDSAFSIGGLLGHLSFALLVIAMMMPSLFALRICVIFSACVGIIFAAFWLDDGMLVFWQALLIAANVIQIARQQIVNRQARFSAEETKFMKERLSSLAPGEARQLLNMGVWANGAVGTKLTIQGKPVDNLVYLADGEVDIRFDGATVGACLPGNYIGEMSVLNGGPASATAIVSEPSRYWMISAEQLRTLHSQAPSIAAALELGIAKDLRHKIMAANSSYVSAEPGM